MVVIQKRDSAPLFLVALERQYLQPELSMVDTQSLDAFYGFFIISAVEIHGTG